MPPHRLLRVMRPFKVTSPSCFELLDDALSGARVVMLGEQSHGDGAAFEVKAELVRHLHLNHGFEVLAFEACFYSLARSWRLLESPGQVRPLVARQLYRHWREAAKMDELWSFIAERLLTDRPLVVAGIDPRHSGPYARENLADELNALIMRRAQDELSTEEHAAFRRVLAGVLEHEYGHECAAVQRRYRLTTRPTPRVSKSDPTRRSGRWRPTRSETNSTR